MTEEDVIALLVHARTREEIEAAQLEGERFLEVFDSRRVREALRYSRRIYDAQLYMRRL